MSAESHKRSFRRFHEEVLLAGDFDAIDELVVDDVVSHNPLPGQAPGAAGLKAALREFRQAFPDLTSTATHLIAEGDLLACRFTAHGSHQGVFMGLPPTGQHFSYEEFVLVRFRAGKIAEHWAVADVMDMMSKMNAISWKSALPSNPSEGQP